MGDTSGTPRKVTLDGITYDVMSDANFSDSGHTFENEGVPTSGRTMQKKVRKPAMTESVEIATNFNEYQNIKDLNDREDTFPISWEDVEGNVYRANGFINIDSPRETETNKTGIQIIVEDADGWSPFAV